jgi:hypothetical protein
MHTRLARVNCKEPPARCGAVENDASRLPLIRPYEYRRDFVKSAQIPLH